MTPTRTVSASARARLQSSDNAAAATAEFFNSVLRDVGMRSSRAYKSFCLDCFCFLAVWQIIWRTPGNVNTPCRRCDEVLRLLIGNYVHRRPGWGYGNEH